MGQERHGIRRVGGWRGEDVSPSNFQEGTMHILMLMLATSLAAIPWSAICLIIALICLYVAAFIGPPITQPGPFYTRINWGWVGVFFFVLSVAVR